MAASSDTALAQPTVTGNETREQNLGVEIGQVRSGARGSSIYTTYLSEPIEIIRALKLLRDQRADVQLSFEGDSTSYVAKVLDVSGAHLLLEDIHPRTGLQKMRKGQEFAMSARGRGIYLHSSANKVVEVESERGVPYFRVRLPTNVLYQQRRKAARFRLPLRVATNGASVTLFRLHGDKQPITGRIVDVSAGGCRAQFDGPLVLDQDEKLRCALDIPDMLNFSADAIIRHSAFDKKSRTLTCGIELASMHVTDRRRLEQFLESIRRMEERSSI